MRWPGHILQMKDGRLSKIVLFGQLYRAKKKEGIPRMGREEAVRKDLRKFVTSWEGLKNEARLDLDGTVACAAVFASGSFELQ